MDNRNNNLTNNTEITFEFVNGQWQVFVGKTALVGNETNVIFERAELNKVGQNHVQDNALIGNQNWEDLQIHTGDGDYNDVNTNVEWIAVMATGDCIDTLSFGADGPFGADGAGSIDFD